MAKKIKITKTEAAYKKLMKSIKQQERYYQQRGFKTVSVSDTFEGMKPNRAGLSELKKYKKIWEAQTAGWKESAKALAKEKVVSAKVAYTYISAMENKERQPGGVQFEEVILDAFNQKVNSMPNYKTREIMGTFTARLRRLLGDEEAARLLAETAEEDKEFEVMLDYYSNEEALQNAYNLIDKIRGKLDETEYPITYQEITEFMESIAEEFEI